MTGRWIRTFAMVALLGSASSSISCGYILHPERRGNTGGAIDGESLVFDLLWLLPGIVPGVVALIVDFSSGAIYVGGGRMAVTIPADGRLAVRVPESRQSAQLEFRLITADRVIARQTAFIGPDIHNQSVELRIDPAARPSPRETMYVEVATATGATARFPTSIEMAPRRQ